MELNDAAVKNYWKTVDPGLGREFVRMESQESWVLEDGSDLGLRLDALGQSFESLTDESLSDEAQAAVFQVLGFLRSGRAFRVLSNLESAVPGFSESFLARAEHYATDPDSERVSQLAAQIHLDRYSHLLYFNLLARVFSRSRVERLEQIVESLT